MTIVAPILAAIAGLLVAVALAAVIPLGTWVWLLALPAALLIAAVAISVLVLCAEWEAR